MFFMTVLPQAMIDAKRMILLAESYSQTELFVRCLGRLHENRDDWQVPGNQVEETKSRKPSRGHQVEPWTQLPPNNDHDEAADPPQPKTPASVITAEQRSLSSVSTLA
jgi:hypothetical protein